MNNSTIIKLEGQTPYEVSIDLTNVISISQRDKYVWYRLISDTDSWKEIFSTPEEAKERYNKVCQLWSNIKNLRGGSKMLVEVNLSPSDTENCEYHKYINTETITGVTLDADAKRIIFDTSSADRYVEDYPSVDEFNARAEEVKSWFNPVTQFEPVKAAPASHTNSLRNCNGYNTSECEHNCKADDCDGCPFESANKWLVDKFMVLPDELKAKFIEEALNHQCITEDEFSMLMGALPTVVEEPDDAAADELAPTDAPQSLYSINVTIYGATATENPAAAITVDNGEFTHELHEIEDTSPASLMHLKSIVAHRLSKAIGEIYTMDWSDKNEHN